MTSQKIKALFISHMVLVILSACQYSQPSPQVVNTPSEVVEQEFDTVTPTLMPVPSNTATVHATEITQTDVEMTATPPEIPTLGPSLTPLATLAPEDVAETVAMLLQTNGGCDLPCLWGITPGKSNWFEVSQRFDTFGIIGANENLSWGSIKIPTEDPDIHQLEATAIIENGIITSIETYNYALPGFGTWFYLSEISALLGIADEVAIWTHATAADDGRRPTGLLVYYQEEGILIEYLSMEKLYDDGETITICPAGTFSQLSVWDPSIQLSFEAAVEQFWEPKRDQLPYPIGIEESAGVSLEDFYYQIISGDEGVCLETPVSLWPDY